MRQYHAVPYWKQTLTLKKTRQLVIGRASVEKTGVAENERRETFVGVVTGAEDAPAHNRSPPTLHDAEMTKRFVVRRASAGGNDARETELPRVFVQALADAWNAPAYYHSPPMRMLVIGRVRARGDDVMMNE